MSTRGRHKTPSALKKLRGTDQPCRMNPEEPMPDILVSAKCPEHLMDDDIAKETWEYIVPLLINMKVLAATDLVGLERICEVVSDIRETRSMIKQYGRVIYEERMDSTGERFIIAKTNPAVAQNKALLSEFRSFANVYGLTPAARASLKVEQPKEDTTEGMFDV